MSFVNPVFKIHSLVQDTLPLPFYFNISSKRVTPNPRYKQRRHKIVRYSSWIVLICIIILNGLRIIWLFFNWASYTKQNIDEGVMYMLAFLGQTSGLASLFVYAEHASEFAFCVNECIKLKSKSEPHFVKLPFAGRQDVKALFIYAFSSPFAAFPVSFIGVPLVVTFDPIQVALGRSIPVKLLAGATYSFGVWYMCWVLVSILMLLFLILDSILTLSTSLKVHGGSSYCQLGKNHIYTEELNRSGRDWISGEFNKSFKRYSSVKLLLRVLSNVVTSFLTRVIFIGILFISFATFATLKLGEYLNIVLYLCAAAGAIVGLIVAISMSHMADVPYQNSLNFQAFWKQRLMKKMDRKRLATCFPVGVNLGPYGIAPASLGLLICEDTFNNTATLLLMGIGYYIDFLRIIRTNPTFEILVATMKGCLILL